MERWGLERVECICKCDVLYYIRRLLYVEVQVCRDSREVVYRVSIDNLPAISVVPVRLSLYTTSA